MNNKIVLLLSFQLILGILIGHFVAQSKLVYTPVDGAPYLPTMTGLVGRLSSHVQMVNLSAPTQTSFRCIKSKTLLNHISPHMCLHDVHKDVFVSQAFRETTSIWEEEGVTRILQLLLRNPHLDFIDIGANIGTYTMYAAALGRFVLGIDCFLPNIERIHRAVQLTNVANRVVLIQNALFTSSGQYVRLSNDAKNIGGQEIDAASNQMGNLTTVNDPYLVRTIQFDELLPILVARGIRGALMKIDIEGSESFVVQSGRQIFDTFDIPFVLMEWMKVRAFADRARVILDFFAQRQYEPRTYGCALLNADQHQTWPGDICWVKKNVSNLC